MATNDEAIRNIEARLATLERDFSIHDHSGGKTKRIEEDNILRGIKSVGSITMATDGTVYKIGMPRGTKNVMFYGFASHYDSDVWGTGTRDVRVMVIGSAQLGKGYNLQPSTTSSVVVGGLLQDITQSSMNQTVLGTTLTSNVSEYYICAVLYPTGSSQPVRLNITKYTEEGIEVTADLSAGWGVIGNFVFT